MNLAHFFAALGSLYIFAVSWPLAKTDFLQHRLPNKLVLPAFPITFFGLLAASLFLNQWGQFLAAVSFSLVAFVVGLLANEYGSLGMGDVKLITVTTMALTWGSLIAPLIALVLGFVLAAAVILIQLLRGRTSLGDAIALGPYLLVGFVVTQMLTWSSYLGGFSPNFFL